MKRQGHLFEKICSFDNLLRAFKRAFSGTGKTHTACAFHFNLENELLQLRHALETETYRPSAYRYFKIYDPKERIISVVPFQDRVVHHAVVGVLEPVFESGFIHDSYATRKNKGTHRAVKRAQQFFRKNTWYLKIDVAKYFENMDHGILLNQIRKKIKDSRTMMLLARIIENSDYSRGTACGKGLPIGNLSSQFLANVYLNPLDHHLKDNLGVKYYLRYMDDMVLFSNDKHQLKNLLSEIDTYLCRYCKLTLKPQATLINKRANGLPFLGFRIFPNLVRIKKEKLKLMQKRLARRKREYTCGKITEEKLAMCAQSMFAHLEFADSLGLRQSYLAPWAGII